VPKGLAFVAVAEVQAPRVPELHEVQEQVKRDLVEARALEKALDQARELRLRALGEGLEKAAKAKGFTRKETPSLVGRGQALGELGASAGLTEDVFTLPEKTLSEPLRLAAGYALVSVLERTPFDKAAFEKDRETLAASLTEAARRRMFEAYLGSLEQRFPVQRTEALRTALGGE
jgi:hypothetical protein